MEFLLLAVLGLATFGTKEMLSSGEEEDQSKDSTNSKNGAKGDSKKNGKDKDTEDADEPKKTAKQELIEAIAKYEAETRSGEISKLFYEITEK
ncbi:MAG: hypothetical protein HC827_18930 [Cyanobacteria bacterium RM1_2_2]|nr:hypothetical protein [Cyanobacteria bacterium RM1_2_2]